MSGLHCAATRRVVYQWAVLSDYASCSWLPSRCATHDMESNGGAKTPMEQAKKYVIGYATCESRTRSLGFPCCRPSAKNRRQERKLVRSLPCHQRHVPAYQFQKNLSDRCTESPPPPSARRVDSAGFRLEKLGLKQRSN